MEGRMGIWASDVDAGRSWAGIGEKNRNRKCGK